MLGFTQLYIWANVFTPGWTPTMGDVSLRS